MKNMFKAFALSFGIGAPAILYILSLIAEPVDHSFETTRWLYCIDIGGTTYCIEIPDDWPL